ncbi:alpha/beta hydrolase [Massilia forsythiae]|uniref:Alpha/beta hydrolase n=1 Tax=Massilia forsythiae TaxID=2728020 RepID=A0A7Z2VZY5_9BURK|nr:alpha/beta hydrolase [Massilia forsythiae]QJE02205.1 alpha/beta hydrolase [Massilia forsythiae]
MSFALPTRRSFLAHGAALALALSTAHALAATPAPPFSSERISVRVEGSGPDVILIPGLNSSPRTWASTIAAVPGYRYHLVQVAGFAGQPAGANKEGLVAAPVAEDIARYIAASGLRRPAVVGHSMGGTIGMMLAARHPDALSRLMVVDMFPFMGAMFGGPGATAAGMQPMAERISAGMRSASPEQRGKRAVDTIDGMVNSAAMRPGAVEDSLASDTDVSANAYRELLTTDLGPELPKIAVPLTVLYVLPKGAPLTDAQIDGFYKAAYAPAKGATLKRIPDSAHFIMWDQPARFQDELKTFLGAR